ncbi:hypothetical protein [Bacillus horti]|uniref:Uncharacterized protein n=1 Tax=Caldalkalibacillus horti TaxID=77523 RepID=A0ABT9VWG6_9BACI|nr:hypothetical protein [Bacillus horti]MDQ0165152.1 hypothetical protein [Bacillus horti]
MAGTRGIAKLRGEQLNDKIIRNRHFDENQKIDEKYIALSWNEHKEILEDTKIDVWVQSNGHAVDGSDSIDVTNAISGRPVSTSIDTEGVVLGQKVELRKAGTDDTPKISSTGKKVYGRLRGGVGTDEGNFYLDFYINGDAGEEAYIFSADAEDIDFRFIVRTNLAVLPVDALVSGGSGFVEGATDAKAYMNLLQLMKDLYGAAGSLNGDGNVTLTKSIIQQLEDEALERAEADQLIVSNLSDRNGSGLVGVVLDPNYSGVTVQQVVSELAERLNAQEELSNSDVVAARTRDEDTPNGFFEANQFDTLKDRLVDTENKMDATLKSHADRLLEIEVQDEREVYEAVGGESSYVLTNGVAKANTLFLSLNGQLQAPGLHYSEILDADGNITGVEFEPDLLEVHEEKPDVLLLWYKKVINLSA